MMITMDDSQVKTLEQIRLVLESSQELEFKGASRAERYGWIEEVLARLDCFRLGKKGEGLVKGERGLDARSDPGVLRIGPLVRTKVLSRGGRF